MMKTNVLVDTTAYIKKVSWFKVVSFSLTILLLFFLYNTYENMAFAILGVGILVVSLLILDCNELLLVAIMLSPSVQMIKIIGYGFAIHSYYLLVIELKYILLQRKLVLKTSLSYIWFFICSFVTFSLYFDTILLFSVFRTTMFFIMIYSMNVCDDRIENYKKLCVDSFVYGTLANVVLGILYYIALGKNIYWGYFGGINNDRNYFSTIIAISMALIMVDVNSYSLKEFIGKMFCFAVILYAGIVSSSRTFLLASIWIVLLVFLLVFQKTTKKRNLSFVLVICSIVAFVFKEQIAMVIQHIISRFTDDTAIGGNGRFDLWTTYLNLTFSTAIRTVFGNGSAINYVNAGEIIQIEHGTAVQLISTLGVLGSVLLLNCYLMTYKRVFKTVSVFRNFICYIPLLVLFTCNFNISSLFLAQFDISIYVCLVAVLKFNENKILRNVQ